MAKKIDLKTAKTLNPGDIIAGLNTGIELVGAAGPILSVLFDKISDWVNQLGKNNPNSPRNKTKRIEALEAQNLLQKELNKTYEARLAALEK